MTKVLRTCKRVAVALMLIPGAYCAAQPLPLESQLPASASALIRYRDGKYVWQQQGD